MFHVEQNLANEIIALLLQADLHPRGLAEKLRLQFLKRNTPFILIESVYYPAKYYHGSQNLIRL